MVKLKECLLKIGRVNNKEFLGKPPSTLLLTKLHWNITGEADFTPKADLIISEDKVVVPHEIDRQVELTIHAELIYNPQGWNQVALPSGRTLSLYDSKHQPLYSSAEFSEEWKATVREYRTHEIV